MKTSVLDSLRHLVAHKDSLLELAATRSVQISTPAPVVTVNVPGDSWWNTPLVGGALAAVLGIGAAQVFGFLHRRFVEKPRMVRALGTELSILLAQIIGTSILIARR